MTDFHVDVEKASQMPAFLVSKMLEGDVEQDDPTFLMLLAAGGIISTGDGVAASTTEMIDAVADEGVAEIAHLAIDFAEKLIARFGSVAGESA